MSASRNDAEQAAPMTHIGHRRTRIDGPLKVSGHATYTSDHALPGMLYAVPVGASIASGAIEAIEAGVAEQMPGVRAVFRRDNLPALARSAPPGGTGAAAMATIDEKRPPLSDDEVSYYGQYVALVVADSFEEAMAASEAVKVTYRRADPSIAGELVADEMTAKSERGDAEAAFKSAEVTVDNVYRVAPETHNPIETHATIADWDGDSLTLYETSQGVVNHRNVVASMLGMPVDKVRVVSRYLGSGFGSKLWPWSQSPLAAAAARVLGRPVKLVLSRQSMFHAAGHRPQVEQRVRIGASRDGKLTALQHDYVNTTAMLSEYEEECGEATPHMYSVPNLKVTAGTTQRNIGVPTSMRGPGAVPGLFATESAMDELAVALEIDPVELRLKNEPEIDEGLGIPFSSRHFQECLTVGAERFGWSRRDAGVGAMRRDGMTIGWGVAACSWIAERMACDASIDLRADGSVRVASAIQDIGTGTYTVMALIVAEQLGVPVDRIEVELGDTRLPAGALSGGSMATASLVAPIHAAIAKAGEALIAAAIASEDSPFAGCEADALAFEQGEVVAKDGNRASMRFGDILSKAGLATVSGQGSGTGTFGSKRKPEYSKHSFGAHFVEVTWEPAIARLRVSRVVSVIDAGRILNPTAARNQIEGAVVMGVGMALFEETEYDRRSGAPVNANLADYLVATHADTPKMDVHFLEYPDTKLNALGARGVGEIGLAGTAAAITSAVYHATGIRVRSLPLRLEDLMGA